jgi:hypothetical protein
MLLSVPWYKEIESVVDGIIEAVKAAIWPQMPRHLGPSQAPGRAGLNTYGRKTTFLQVRKHDIEKEDLIESSAFSLQAQK